MGFGSTSYGLLIASVLIINTGLHIPGYSYNHPRLNNSIAIAFMIAIFILIHGLIASLTGGLEFSFSRLIISLFILLVLFIAAFFFSDLVKRIDTKRFESVMWSVTALMIILAVAQIVKPWLAFHGFSSIHYFIAVYSEPSHYIIAFLPIYLYRFVIGTFISRILIFGVGTYFYFALESMTFLIFLFGLFCLYIISKPKLFRLSLLILLLVIITLITLWAGDLDGLDFIQMNNFLNKVAMILNLLVTDSLPSGNLSYISLSSLSFFADWHQAIINLINTSGIGVGFQQNGLVGDRSYIKDIIFNHSGAFAWTIKLETFSVMPKLISEFGIFAFIFLIFYLNYFWASLIQITNSLMIKDKDIDKKMLLINCFVACNAINIFLRGTGYFTTSTFFLVVAFFYLSSLKKMDG